jgi:ankyrin repeat protein
MYTEAATWLCARGASVHAQKNDGWHDTALHYAASKNHMAVAKLLLAFGADPAALNFAGEGGAIM